MARGRGSAVSAKEQESRTRLCAATRVERPREELIRFVADPGGTIVPDLACRLPGRGVWITAEKAAVAAAMRSKAFARSLRREVKVPEDLPARIERMLERRTLEALSLANKASLVVTGFAQVDELIEKGGAVALLHAQDAAADGRQKLDRKFRAVQGAASRPAPVVAALTAEQMSLAMGRSNVVHAALKAGGASERFLSEAGRLVRYRSGLGTPPTADAPNGHERSNGHT